MATKAQVVAKIAKLSFKKNDNGQYTHNAITTLSRGIERIMKGLYNPCDAGKGMSGLLIQNAYGPKSNEAITLDAVLKESKEAADKEMKATGTTTAPAFTLQSESKEEANWRNMAAQAMIGTKEGVVIGTNITNSILQTSDGDFKSVDDYTVHKVFQAAFKNANRPPMVDVLAQLIKVLHYTFNFRKKLRTNMETVQNLANRMSAYGINVGTPSIALMLLQTSKQQRNTNTDKSFNQQCRAYALSTRTTTNTTTRP
jgi:predicted transcriptional regulator